MAKEIASVTVHCTLEPDRSDYKLVVLPNSVTYGSDGTPNVQTIDAYVYRESDGVRTPVTVNKDTSSHCLFLNVTNSTGETKVRKVSSLNASILAGARSARFDLVAVENVGTGNSYSDSDVIVSEAVSLVYNGSNGAVPAIAFTRSKTEPGRPSGGTYIKPVPDTAGWSDAPPSGSDPLWMSKATFTVDDTVPPTWSAPSPVADDTDIEFIFSSEENPGDPDNTHRHPDNGADGWGKNPVGAVWMAIAKKSGGAWGVWNVVRIKGETGKNVVFARVSPSVIEMKRNGKINTYDAYIEVYDGGELVPASQVAHPQLDLRSLGLTVKGQSADGGQKYYYRITCPGINDIDKDVSISVTYKGRQYPVIIPLRTVADGIDGNPGKDAVVYRLVVNPMSVHYDLNTGAYDTPGISCSVIKVKGDGVAQVTDLASEGLTLTHANYQSGVFVGENPYIGSVALSSVPYSRIDFVLRKGGVEIARECTSVVFDGKNGTTGKNGVWVPPPMLWEDYPDGYEFKCGDVSEGEDHMDMVLCKKEVDGETKYYIYRCRVSHTKDSSHFPMDDNYDGGAKPDAYWERSTHGIYKFLATDLLLANNARIEFLSGQSIRIGEGAKMCGYFGAPTNGGAILYTGGSEVTTATYVVFKEGRARWGDAGGQRIEIDPATRRMLIYDASNELCAIHSGDTLDYTKVGNETGGSAASTVTQSAMNATLNGIADVRKTIASGTATRNGRLRVTLPKIRLASNGSAPAASTGMQMSAYTAEAYLEIAIDGRDASSNPIVQTVRGVETKESDAAQYEASIPAGSTYEVRLRYMSSLDASGTATVSALGTASVAFEALNKVCHYGSNGWYISASNTNYAYYIFDSFGVLHVKVVCNGKEIINSDK